MSSRQKVIIDTDPGVDDTIALLLALSAPELEVVGITICLGNNNDLELLARNACLALQICGRSGIPVVQGRPEPLAQPYGGQSGIEIHGPNGIGGVPHPEGVDYSPMTHTYESAAQFLIETCRQQPGEIGLITLGPVTNIGEAIRSDPAFAGTVRNLTMMGGTCNGQGNKAPAAEANVHNDPEAAKLVFGAISNITMAGLNVTTQVPLERLRERLLEMDTDVGRFLHQVSEHYVNILKSWGNKRLGVHDSSAVLAAVAPQLFVGEMVCVDVETQGELTRGATVCDWLGHWQREPQTNVLLEVNVDGFLDEMITRLGQIEWTWVRED